MSLKKLVNEITKPLTEDIKIPVSVGDTILTGRFKTKKTKVKSIGKDDYGMPTINGRKVVNFRVAKVDEEGIVSADGTIQGGSKVSKVLCYLDVLDKFTPNVPKCCDYNPSQKMQ